MRTGQIETNYFASYSGYDMSYAGTYDVDATFTTYYSNYDTSFTINDLFTITVSNGGGGNEKTPIEIYVLTFFCKTEYQVGDYFEKPLVYCWFDDDTEEEVGWDCTYSGYNLGVQGSYTVLVTYVYEGITLTTTYGITVGEASTPTLTGIQVQYATTEFEVGDSFIEPDVYANYSDGSSSYITYYCSFSGYNMDVPGTYTVTVTYEEFTTQYTITVASSSGPKSVTFSSSLTSGSYNTGNYGTRYSNDYEFTY